MRLDYDFVVCGSGSSGLVVASRLAETDGASVLLLEAGGTDQHPDVVDARRWRNNIGSEREWGFRTAPNVGLDGRSIALTMGHLLGGGSSINVMGWARGHRADWDHYAAVSGEPAWSYENVTRTYDGIERFDRDGNGIEGPADGLRVHPAMPSLTTSPMLGAADSMGIPTFERLNGPLWESDVGGAAAWEWRTENGERLSLYRDYIDGVGPRRDLTVLTHATVLRINVANGHAVGVSFSLDGRVHEARADREVVLCLGAVNTPKTLMRSGIGEADELRKLGIDVVQDLPGVGKGLQDHLLLTGFVWERADEPSDDSNAAILDIFATTEGAASPNIKVTQIDGARPAPGQVVPNTVRNTLTLMPGLVAPRSSGQVRIVSAEPDVDPVIETRYLTEPEDLDALLAAVDLARRLASSDHLRGLVRRELFTEGLRGEDLETFVRRNASTYWHPSCSARMGRDRTSVVDGRLRVHGIDGLRIADASIMPRIPISLTMAPCVVIGEMAARFLKETHGL